MIHQCRQNTFRERFRNVKCSSLKKRHCIYCTGRHTQNLKCIYFIHSPCNPECLIYLLWLFLLVLKRLQEIYVKMSVCFCCLVFFYKLQIRSHIIVNMLTRLTCSNVELCGFSFYLLLSRLGVSDNNIVFPSISFFLHVLPTRLGVSGTPPTLPTNATNK